MHKNVLETNRQASQATINLFVYFKICAHFDRKIGLMNFTNLVVLDLHCRNEAKTVTLVILDENECIKIKIKSFSFLMYTRRK